MKIKTLNESSDNVYNKILSEGTLYKRIARYGEFDNGKVIHNDWKKLTDEEAENLAKEASIENPGNVYYVAYDNIMNPSSDLYWQNGQSYNFNEVSPRDLYKEDLSDDIRSNNLQYDNEIDALYAEDGDTLVQFQDRNSLARYPRNPKERNSKFEKQPRVSSKTWGRVWKNGKLVKNTEGSKYEVRQEIADYLDNMNEGIEEYHNVPEYADLIRRLYPLVINYQDDNNGVTFEEAIDEVLSQLQEDDCLILLKGFYNGNVMKNVPSEAWEMIASDLDEYSVHMDDIDESITEARHNYGHEGPFWYLTKHGLGPGMLPKDVKVVDIYEDDDYNTWVALDSVLTTQELNDYEMKEEKPPVK